MWTNFSLLFLLTLSPLALFSFMPKENQKLFKLVLSFSGSYLFSLTLLHILPEIYTNATSPLLVGIFILMGFFLQLILSFFAQGVEHGHLHHAHKQDLGLPLSIVFSISLHAFLEGNMLIHPFHQHDMSDNTSLMVGLILHKIPEAFALLSILYGYHTNQVYALGIFVIYALLSPLGMMTGNYAYLMEWLTPTTMGYVFALIAGNFMHISTIIFFESSPQHELKTASTLAKILGAICAVAFELSTF
jgi:zinc transporter ZupT